MANTFNHNDKVVITDGGSVGIGTNSPSYKLDVNGASRFTENVTAGNSNSNVHTFKGNSFTIDGSAPYLYLYDNSNSYGGGATMGIYFSTTGGSQGFIGVPSTSYNDIYITNDPAQGTVAGETSGHAHILLLPHNNVGIGTTSPSEKLEVAGNLKIQANATNAISFEDDGAFTSMYSDAVLRIYQRVEVWGGGDGKQYLDVRDASGNVKVMLNAADNSYFASNNVGIGTTSPSYTLDISGTQRVTGNVVFEGQISFPGVNGNNFVVDTDGQRIVWEHQRNGTRKMTFYHETDADTFNFSFASGNNLQINGNRIVTANELGTAAASAATDFVAVSGDTMSGDLNMGSNDIKAVNSIVLNNVEGSAFGTVNGTLIFDENFYGDTEYGTAWAGGNGGGLAIYGEDGWNRMLSDKNAQWFLGTAAFSRSDDFVAVTGDTMTGNLLLNNGVEILSNDTGGTARTIMRVTSGNVLQYGWSGSGAVQFMGGGSYTERMRIHTDGNIGIGTTSPAYKLTVAGRVSVENDILHVTAASPTLLFSVPGGGIDSKIYNDGSGNFIIGHGSNSDNPPEKFRIDSSGNVGIGTTSPSEKLHVNSGSGNVPALFESTDGLSLITFKDNSTTTTVGVGASADNIVFYSASERMRIDGSGNVGIGTTSTSDKLHVAGSVKITTGDVNLDAGRAITFYGNSNTNHSISSTNNTGGSADDIRINSYGAIYFNLDSNSNNTSGADFKIARHGGTSTLSDYLFTLSGETGNVGIGTTSPGAKLEVFGTGNTLRLDSAANGSKEILFRNVGTGTATIKTDGDLKLYVEDAGKNILFDTTGGEKMRITASGNVGIGTTSPAYKLDVSGDIRATETVISGGQQLVIPAVGRFLFDSSTDYNTSTEGSVAISTEGAIQGGDNTVYTINERDITFNEGGFYKISVYITYTSTTQRANPGIRLKKNGTDYISPWGLSGYLRYASGHNEASNFVDTIAYFDEGDYVEVYTKAFAASGTCTDDGSGSHILIERIAM